MATVSLLMGLLAMLDIIHIASAQIDTTQFAPADTIHRDIAIIGGGASGAHAAVRLREDFNKSVVVIERQDKLGGHVDTYIDPSGTPHDYGVQVYFPFLDALDFIARFNLTLVPGISPRGNTTTRYIDFSTGLPLPSSFTGPSSTETAAAVRRFRDLAIASGYDHMTEPGYWNLPAGSAIPEDLALPVGEFARKHNIYPLLARMWDSTGGDVGSRGNFTDVPTITFMKSCPIAWVKVLTGEVPMYHIDSSHGNQALYERVMRILGKTDVLYLHTLVASERSDSGVKLVVQDARTRKQKLVLARKLLIAIPPSRENLAPMDLNEHEKAVFGKARYGRSHTGIARHSRLPADTILRNMPASAVPDPTAPFLGAPFVLSLYSYGGNASQLYSLGASGSDYEGFDEGAAQAMARAAVKRMEAAKTVGDLGGEELQFVAWSDHKVGGYGASSEDLRAGWMTDLYALQGKRATWFTGGAVAADFSTMLWKFNDDLISRILKEM